MPAAGPSGVPCCAAYHGVVTQRGRLDPDRLIDLYIYEDERGNAFEKVLDAEDLDALRRYRGNVADLDPEAYFETCRDLLEPYLAAETGRDHYRTVTSGHDRSTWT